MTIEDFKLGTFNAISFMVSFTHVENSLKVILLLASIIYTAQKIYETHKKKND
jgi:hypothetical protein|tara:strand:+ start:2068 stop:2226 length:159 start_codon:yes stop_codon:yes gene_type:complete